MGKDDRTVEVFLNGDSRLVPTWVPDEDTFRTALRIPPGMNVSYAQRPSEPIDLWDGHFFVDGDRYVTTGPQHTCSDDDKPSDSWSSDLPTFEGPDPDAWKRESD
jgi:hypothetical protein